MKVRIAVGQTYVDTGGDVFEVVNVSRTKLTLQSEEDQLVVSDTSDFIADLESGDLEPVDVGDGDSETEFD
jgi:hypothetical protein